MERIFDPQIIKHYLLHPEIYPEIKDDRDPDELDRLSVSPVCLLFEGGLIYFTEYGDDWLIHPVIEPAYRRHAKGYVEQSLEYMTNEYSGDIYALIPECLFHVRWFANQCGFRHVGYDGEYVKRGITYPKRLLKWVA